MFGFSEGEPIMGKEFSKQFTLYKARGDGNGAASQFSLSSKKDCVFLEMANQIGKDKNDNAKFDWDNKIIFKLGCPDMGEILATLVGLQDGVGPFDVDKQKHRGLYHTNQSGNAILYFWRDQYKRFQIYLSVKRDGTQTVVKHAITKGEACVLSVILRRAIEVMYCWD
jgi:hypothetical protein